MPREARPPPEDPTGVGTGQFQLTSRRLVNVSLADDVVLDSASVTVASSAAPSARTSPATVSTRSISESVDSVNRKGGETGRMDELAAVVDSAWSRHFGNADPMNTRAPKRKRRRKSERAAGA